MSILLEKIFIDFNLALDMYRNGGNLECSSLRPWRLNRVFTVIKKIFLS